MPASIDRIIELLAKPGGGGFQEVFDLATESPHLLADLVVAGTERLPGSSTAIDAALELVPDAELDRIAAAAVAALRDGRDPGRSQAAGIVADLSLQAPHTLQPFLEELWWLHPNSSSYYAEWPWRGASDDRDLDLLRKSLTVPDENVRKRAWEGLLETRTDAGWATAIDAIGVAVPEGRWADAMLGLVGIERQGTGFRRLYQPMTTHIEFPEGFLDLPRWSSVDGRMPYPTWHLDAEVVGRGRFGGRADASCKVCSGQLHRLLAIDESPFGIDVPAQVVTCMSCLGWSEPVLFFEHRGDRVAPGGWAVAEQTPDFPAEPLPTADVVFRRTPDRWRLQDWANSNDRQSLNRLGGEPTWIQDADFPACPECATTMTFFLQLDSLDIAGGPWWLWGSGGILYAFWCQACSISATHWQCT